MTTKVTKKVFRQYMNQFKPLDVKIKDVWSKKGSIIRKYTVNGQFVACVINWESYWMILCKKIR